jgi:hypothetical protein
MEDSTLWINERLKKFGFYPELNSPTYIKLLKAKKGITKANSFLDQVDMILANSRDQETEIAKLIGEDEELLKLVYSTGIRYSVAVLNAVLDVLDDLEVDPAHILELGAANGWALSLLDEYFDSRSKLTLVEKNRVWKAVSPKFNVVNLSYGDYDADTKADLIFTIFGAPYFGFEELVACAARALSDGGYFIAALRIPNELMLSNFIKLGATAGLKFDSKRSGRVAVKSPQAQERFPILVFQRGAAVEEEPVGFDLLREF